MGGTVPIGYGMEARRLVPVERKSTNRPLSRWRRGCDRGLTVFSGFPDRQAALARRGRVARSAAFAPAQGGGLRRPFIR